MTFFTITKLLYIIGSKELPHIEEEAVNAVSTSHISSRPAEIPTLIIEEHGRIIPSDLSPVTEEPSSSTEQVN